MKYEMRVRRLLWNNRHRIIFHISTENFIWRRLRGKVNNFPQINFPAWTSKTFYLIYFVIISHPTILKPTYIQTTNPLCRLITILCWFFLQLDFELRNIMLSFFHETSQMTIPFIIHNDKQLKQEQNRMLHNYKSLWL